MKENENDWRTYITVETALLAKEKGFDIDCVDCYCQPAEYEDKENETGHLIPVDGEPFDSWTGLVPDYSIFLCYRPTKAVLQKWLIDKHNIHVIPKPKVLYPDDAVGKEYYVEIFIDGGTIDNYDVYLGYDDALEAGLKKCLSKIK